MSFSRSSSMTIGLEGQETSNNQQDQHNGHDVEPEPVDLKQLLQENGQDPLPKRLVISIDFGTTYSAVSYVAVPQGCPSESVDLVSIRSIQRFPENRTFFAGDQMAMEVPTEVIYPLNRHFRDQDYDSWSRQDSDDEIGDDTFSSTYGIDLGNRAQPDGDENILMPADASDLFLWGYQVHKVWSLPTTHSDAKNEPLARFKLLLDDTPRTANIRATLNRTLSALKRRRVVQKPLHVIADFLTQLLRHTQRQLQLEGFDDDWHREIVLCVPAIWTQKACRDMQGCLTEAMARANFRGVDVQNNSIENLFIVSEPEAAAAYMIMTSGEVRPGDTFVLLDAGIVPWELLLGCGLHNLGGGTVDANTYLVSDDEPLTLKEERVNPGGGLHGSSYLNEEFREYLNQRLAGETYLEQGTDTIKSIVERFMIDQFEYRIKRYYDCYDRRPVHYFQIPNLRADQEKRFIDGSIVKVVLMGGFGTSISLIKYLKHRLADFCQANNCHITLMRPQKGFNTPREILAVPSLTFAHRTDIVNAVASGAVFRALNKDGGPERMARASYGIQRTEPFKQYSEHEGQNATKDVHDGLPYITKTVDWVLKLGQRVSSVWECRPFTCSHTFNLNEKNLICKEILYVSDHSTKSHYKLSHPNNKDAEKVGEIIIDCTFLRDKGRISPVDPIILDNGKQIGKRHYRVNFTMAIRVVDRHLECFAIHSQKIIKRCRINIASGFRPGVN
ncbi:hypothetical protein KAF25_006900 [Fusarium avenaceum]|uniref:Hsp70 protein n=1 Tax=Fusarium avenaceum TaxID=40199 RepID=A0A9P7GRB9_9HYPO|nr:hypothetical protein KAF25_006900 [Fusarium avenaceum]